LSQTLELALEALPLAADTAEEIVDRLPLDGARIAHIDACRLARVVAGLKRGIPGLDIAECERALLARVNQDDKIHELTAHH